MSRNVLFVAYYFPPRCGSGVQRSAKFAKYLPRCGYEPIVLTAALDDLPAARDDGLLRELPNVTVYRARSHEALVRKLGAAGLGPLISLLVRPDAESLWRRHAVKLARKIAARHKIDLVYTSAQPWSSALVGLELKQMLGVPWVLDFRDLWAECTHATWPTRLHFWLDRWLERRVVREADAIVVVSPGMAQALAEAHPEHAHKLHVIHNGYDGDDIPESAPPLSSPRLKVAFAGRLQSWRQGGPVRRLARALGYRNCVTDFSTHSPLYLLRAVSGLLAKRPDLAGRLRVDLIGQVGRDNEKLVTEMGLDRVVELGGRLSHHEAVAALQAADVLFLPMMTEEDERRSYNVSGKLFEYLALGKPILAAVPEGDAGDIVRRAGAGWVIAPYDVEGMTTLLAQLIERGPEMLRRLHRDEDYIRQFEREALARQLADLFASLLPSPAPHGSVALRADETRRELRVEAFRV